MQVREFMSLVLQRTTDLLPQELRRFSARIRFVWLQLHYHSPKIHYEVWLVRKSNRIEIGLHFEGSKEFSYRWAEVMAAHMPEVQARLGPQFELEEWTPSWTRVHQTIPYDPLSETLAEDVARLFAQVITVLQPIVEKEIANIPADLESMPAAASPARPFRHRRRSPRQ